MSVIIRKWGNSLAVRIPRSVAHSAGIAEGANMDVTVRDGKVILTQREAPSLKELLAGVRKGSRPRLADWGPPRGHEVW